MKIDSNFFQVVNIVKTEALHQLKENITQIKVFEEWTVSINEYEEQFDDAIEVARNNCLEKLKNQIQESLKTQIDELISEKLSSKNIDKEFWYNFNIEYINAILNKMSALKNNIQDFYKLKPEEIQEYLENLEEVISKYTIKNFEKSLRETSTITLEYFKDQFLFDDNKMPRKWNRIPEEQIDEIYKNSKSKSLILFEILSKLKVIKMPIRNSKKLYELN